MHIILRGSTHYLRRRIPRRWQSVDPRKTVEVSFHTDSEKEALAKAQFAWDQMIGAWEARRDGDSEDAEARFVAARELAARRNFCFLPVGRIAKDDIDSFLATSGTPPFVRRIVMDSTEAARSANAETMLIGQSIPVLRIGLVDMCASPIQRGLFAATQEVVLEEK